MERGQGHGGPSIGENEALVLMLLCRATRLAAASVPPGSEVRLPLEVLADDLSRAVDGGPVRLRLVV